MFQSMFSKSMSNMSGNVIREILKLTQQPDIISFAGGLPSADTFPADELQEIAAEVLTNQKKEILQYGTSEGYQPLREYIAESSKVKGINVDSSEVLITSGSQQGIDLVGKSFINPGDGIIVENPTYLAAIQIFSVYQAQFNVGASDEEGILIPSLNNLAQSSANKLLYLVPTFQNPTGITMSLKRRQEVASLLDKQNLILVEDDPYGDLRYTGSALPAIKSFDQENRVIYLGSFSKIISPGLRVGYAIGNKEILRKMVIGKQTTDVHTSNLSQAIVYEFCIRGLLEPHLAKIKLEYGAKLQLMLKLIEEHFPAEVKWRVPEGGLFIWFELPKGVSSTELLKEAIKDKVAFIPGDSFFAHGGGSNTMRLNFSNATHEGIEQGIERLGKVIKRYLVGVK